MPRATLAAVLVTSLLAVPAAATTTGSAPTDAGVSPTASGRTVRAAPLLGPVHQVRQGRLVRNICRRGDEIVVLVELVTAAFDLVQTYPGPRVRWRLNQHHRVRLNAKPAVLPENVEAVNEVPVRIAVG